MKELEEKLYIFLLIVNSIYTLDHLDAFHYQNFLTTYIKLQYNYIPLCTQTEEYYRPWCLHGFCCSVHLGSGPMRLSFTFIDTPSTF